MRLSAMTTGLALGIGLVFSAPAFAGALREPVLTALSGVEDVPTADNLRALGSGVEAELLEIAQDANVARTRRARAVQALGWFPSPASRSFLEQTLGVTDRLMARKAAYALANGWGNDAVPVLTIALGNDDVQLRDAAARALAIVGSSAADAALRERLSVETNETVQATIQSVLAD